MGEFYENYKQDRRSVSAQAAADLSCISSLIIKNQSRFLSDPSCGLWICLLGAVNTQHCQRSRNAVSSPVMLDWLLIHTGRQDVCDRGPWSTACRPAAAHAPHTQWRREGRESESPLSRPSTPPHPQLPCSPRLVECLKETCWK